MNMAYLELIPASADPSLITSHAVSVGISLDTFLDLASNIENTAESETTINDIRHKGLRLVESGVADDGVIPLLHVRVIRDDAGQSIPLGLGRNKARSIGAN